MVLLGSGGHTGEMIRILSTIHSLKDFKHITFVWSIGDISSYELLKKLIESSELANYSFLELPRARTVGEAFTSSVVSTLKSIIHSFTLLPLIEYPPDILMLNGPGTSVPLVLFYTLSNLRGTHTKMVYIESLARVNKLSMSGLLCRPLVHRFVVQWKGLAKKTNGEYYGILV
jgi:beta-1,4-N-acetylglucosaminyltransferase